MIPEVLVIQHDYGITVLETRGPGGEFFATSEAFIRFIHANYEPRTFPRTVQITPQSFKCLRAEMDRLWSAESGWDKAVRTFKETWRGWWRLFR